MLWNNPRSYFNVESIDLLTDVIQIPRSATRFAMSPVNARWEAKDFLQFFDRFKDVVALHGVAVEEALDPVAIPGL